MAISLKTKLRYGAYDFSNSGFLTIFQSLLFPIVLTASLGPDQKSGDITLWGGLVAVSSILAIAASPVIGKFADHVGRPTVFRWLVLTAAIGAALSGLMTHSVLLLAITFLAFNTLFELSQNTYDALLPRLTTTSADTNTLSAFAWGLGYVGGALFVGVYLLLTSLGVSDGAILSTAAALYFVLSVPAIRLATEQDTPPAPKLPPLKELLRVRPPVPWRQLATYWFIADAVVALTYFMPLYLSRELNLSTFTIAGLMIGGQLVAFPATTLSAKLVNRSSHRTVIAGSLVVWLVSLSILILGRSLLLVSLAVVIGALVFGTTQATLRSHFAHFLKPGEPAQGFGFYAVAQKSASILAPTVGALLAMTTGRLNPIIMFVALLIFIALLLSIRLPLTTERETRPVAV